MCACVGICSGAGMCMFVCEVVCACVYADVGVRMYSFFIVVCVYVCSIVYACVWVQVSVCVGMYVKVMAAIFKF